jgi:hypothetical protein
MDIKKLPAARRTGRKTSRAITRSVLCARIERKQLEVLRDPALPELPVAQLREALAPIPGTGVTRRDVLKAGARAAGGRLPAGAHRTLHQPLDTGYTVISTTGSARDG